jgi:CubicO group peptidase (beta-lactamase class C family)
MPTLEEIGLRAVRWTRGPGDCGPEDQASVWEHVEPADVGLDRDALEAAAARVTSGEFPNIHAFLVVRDGKLAFERYFAGADARFVESLGAVEFDSETLHDARSVTKSVVGALVGIAHADGAIADLDAPISSFFPDYLDGSRGGAGGSNAPPCADDVRGLVLGRDEPSVLGSAQRRERTVGRF